MAILSFVEIYPNRGGKTGAIDEDVAILHRGEVRPVDIGLVNGVPFHSVSGLGFAVAVASERERTRRWIPFNRGLATTVAARTSVWDANQGTRAPGVLVASAG